MSRSVQITVTSNRSVVSVEQQRGVLPDNEGAISWSGKKPVEIQNLPSGDTSIVRQITSDKAFAFVIDDNAATQNSLLSASEIQRRIGAAVAVDDQVKIMEIYYDFTDTPITP